MLSSEKLAQLYTDYLYYSYFYYIKDFSIVSDNEYDYICHLLGAHWYKFEHPYRNLATYEDMDAGTGYAIKYPTELIGYFNVRFMLEGRSNEL